MGKATGFMEYSRKENPYRDVRERLSDYEDLHVPQGPAERTCQASRCMNCGVPFCQSDFGCPLHNLDMIAAYKAREPWFMAGLACFHFSHE